MLEKQTHCLQGKNKCTSTNIYWYFIITVHFHGRSVCRLPLNGALRNQQQCPREALTNNMFIKSYKSEVTGTEITKHKIVEANIMCAPLNQTILIQIFVV